MHIFPAIYRTVLVYISLDPAINDIRAKMFCSINFLQTSLADRTMITYFRDKQRIWGQELRFRDNACGKHSLSLKNWRAYSAPNPQFFIFIFKKNT